MSEAPAAMGSRGPMLDVRGLSIWSSLGGRPKTIVSNIDLHVGPSETVGIVGESGSGKSMTARALARLLPAGVLADGIVMYGGRNLLALSRSEMRRVRGAEIGLLLQDPFTMLNPVMSCGPHISETLAIQGVPRAERRGETLRCLAEVGITDQNVADKYPFQLSGGMRQRVAIAAALARDPSLLIADEPSTALDVTTQSEMLALIKRVQLARGMSLILITHDLRVAFSVCDRIYVLYAGSVLEVASATALEAEPLHPYTLGLLLSEPPLDRRLDELVDIPGAVPAADDVSGICAFAPRCRWMTPKCVERRPPLEELLGSRASACARLPEIRTELSRLRRQAVLAEHTTSRRGERALLVKVDAVSKTFPAHGRRGPLAALRDVSIEIHPGESVGLVGESGSGKTTLARCLVGLEIVTAGTITIGATTMTDFRLLSRTERRRLRETVQIVFQDPYSTLNPMRTVGATLREAIRARRPNGRHKRDVAELLQLVGLPAAYAARKPVALSGGERQRVAIARALAVRPKVLVCDEPVSALDVSVQAQILNLLRRLRRDVDVSILFISHDLAVIRQVVETVYVLYRGEVVEKGPVDDVLDRPKHPYTVRLIESIPAARSDHDVGRAAQLLNAFGDSNPR